jgi:hypothetical protein
MFNNNDHIFKLNNRPLKNYPYPFHLSYCPIKSCCNDEYAKLNANNIFSKVNTFNNKVVINSGNLQVKDLASFPSTSPGFGNYTSVNGTPYYYDPITNNWINLLQSNNSNTFTLTSNPGTLDSSGNTTFTIDIPNIYGQAFKYTLYTDFPPQVLNFYPNEEINIQDVSGNSFWGIGTGFAIFQPYLCNGVSNGAYVFNSYSSPGFDVIYPYSTPATTTISNSYLYTSKLVGDYTGNGNNTQKLIGEIITPFIN